MHAVVRRYTAARALVEALDQHQVTIEQLMSAVDGFVSYHAIRAGDEMTTLTVCADHAGADATTKVAAQWIRDNLAAGTVAAPEVSEGEIFVHFLATQPPALDSTRDATAATPV